MNHPKLNGKIDDADVPEPFDADSDAAIGGVENESTMKTVPTAGKKYESLPPLKPNVPKKGDTIAFKVSNFSNRLESFLLLYLLGLSTVRGCEAMITRVDNCIQFFFLLLLSFEDAPDGSRLLPVHL